MFGARERGAWSEKFQVYDGVPPTHVSHNIMKQRLGEDAIACCYSEKSQKEQNAKNKMKKLRKNEKMKKNNAKKDKKHKKKKEEKKEKRVQRGTPSFRP